MADRQHNKIEKLNGTGINSHLYNVQEVYMIMTKANGIKRKNT
jgi:hypothetical protein